MNKLQKTVSLIAVGSVPLGVMFLLSPQPFAGAQGMAIFDTIDSNISKEIGPAIAGMNTAASDISKIDQQLANPIANINAVHSFINKQLSMLSFMNQVSSTYVHAATLPTTQSLESVFLSGSGVTPVFMSTYGQAPGSNTAALSVRQHTDMSDAVSLGAIDLSARAIQSASTTVSTATTLQQNAATAAPGFVSLVGVQAQAAQLQTLSIEHQLLAAQLREEATVLALQALDEKRSVANTTGTKLSIDLLGGH